MKLENIIFSKDYRDIDLRENFEILYYQEPDEEYEFMYHYAEFSICASLTHISLWFESFLPFLEIPLFEYTLKSRVISWWKENKSHSGKWTLIGRIAADLELETFPHQYAGRGKFYDWNNDIARITNELVRERTIELSAEGRAYFITYNENHEVNQ